jgi:hypothetical protein
MAHSYINIYNNFDEIEDILYSLHMWMHFTNLGW